jgi:hypothetical protein
MCCQLAEDEKAQPATGFPEGWRFYFTDYRELPWYKAADEQGRMDYMKTKELVGLVLLSPTGERFRSVEAASNELRATLDSEGDFVRVKRDFYKSIGHVTVNKSRNHVLIGKAFCQEWTDFQGQKKVIYGTITECKDDDHAGGNTLTVFWNQESRSLVNSIQSISAVPETLEVTEVVAVGGCVPYDAGALDYVDAPQRWLVPKMRKEELVRQEDGSRLPRLKLIVDEFLLDFRTARSSIPNAGHGVFVSCRRLAGSAPCFELAPGKLLDLGVYAPFRSEDRRKYHIFLIKNFVHSLKCEERTFELGEGKDTDDFIFDITCDRTGDLHELAKRHITAYVNETNGVDVPTVHARHDPEGAVHYLLGHDETPSGPFRLACDGSEIEIFIDYGEAYENVRCRKNYSRLPPEELEQKMKELQADEIDYIREISTYNPDQIKDCIHFFHDLFCPELHFDSSVVDRALLVVLLLKARACDIASGNRIEQGWGGRRQSDVRQMKQVAKTAGKLVQYLYGYWNNAVGLKQSLLSQSLYVSVLEHVFKMQADDLKNMPAEVFLTKILNN